MENKKLAKQMLDLHKTSFEHEAFNDGNASESGGKILANDYGAYSSINRGRQKIFRTLGGCL